MPKPLKKKPATSEPMPSEIWGTLKYHVNVGDFESIEYTFGARYAMAEDDDPEEMAVTMTAALNKEVQRELAHHLMDLSLSPSKSGQLALNIQRSVK